MRRRGRGAFRTVPKILPLLSGGNREKRQNAPVHTHLRKQAGKATPVSKCVACGGLDFGLLSHLPPQLSPAVLVTLLTSLHSLKFQKNYNTAIPRCQFQHALRQHFFIFFFCMLKAFALCGLIVSEKLKLFFRKTDYSVDFMPICGIIMLIRLRLLANITETMYPAH